MGTQEDHKKIIRVFPRRTKWTPDDQLAFVGDPPWIHPEADEVFVSVVFTWDIEEGWRLKKSWEQYYLRTQIGGPAFGTSANEFTPGLFLKHGVTITSRGCFWKCDWCHVPKREGKIIQLEIKDGWIVQDNNLLACSREHIEAVFEMLRRQKRGIEFKGGLDSRLLKRWHIDLLKSIKVHELWFSCDSKERLTDLEKAKDLISDFRESKKRCYVMIGYGNETLLEAEKRLEAVYHLGFLPFSQLYQPEKRIDWNREWRQLNKKWCRPAAYRKKKEAAPIGQLMKNLFPHWPEH